MKERPILFSAPMVQALLDGRKTQTRRVCKASVVSTSMEGVDDGVATFSRLHGDGPGHDVQEDVYQLRSRYGKTGDRLWVKETHLRTTADEIHFRADGDFPEGAAKMLGGWRPSIFMSRKFSRILLEVTAVRVERLQDISEEDAIAEGCFALGDCECTAVRQYRELWESINGAGSWDANPWVWVIEFRRIEQ